MKHTPGLLLLCSLLSLPLVAQDDAIQQIPQPDIRVDQATLAASSDVQHTSSSIKGYWLGETLAEYMRRDRNGEAQLKLCDKKLVKHPKDRYCRNLVDTLANSQSGRMELETTDTRLIFSLGKLVWIRVELPHEFGEVVKDMTSFMGTPPTTFDDLITQNGYGATFHHPIACWVTSDLMATISDTSHATSYGYLSSVTLKLMTAAEFDVQRKYDEANRENTLR